MKKILVLGIVLLIAACSSKKEGNMIVTGQIKGLKKGKLYLQKIEKDTILSTIDSVSIHGSDLFTLTANVDEPEMYYLTFDGNTTNKYITFSQIREPLLLMMRFLNSELTLQLLALKIKRF